MSSIVGIDYGGKRCGIARADTETHIATPHSVVSTSELITHLMRMYKESTIERIIMGHSMNLVGDDNPVMEEVRVAASEIETELQVPVSFHDERFSSVEAATQLNVLNTDRGRKPKKEFELDAGAATIILQSYLDRYDKGTD